MSLDRIRQIVSGNKARFVDTGVDLDLVYVTERIIIMGWPATGFASTYRNRRRDVLKFITSRHGDKWWVWNLCPLYENAYSPESMHNRVSRYPFPDHHPPPLPLLPLAVREMTAWLESDPERVAIIHCKAGKGRSGTLLCSYLLSLPTLPDPPSARPQSQCDREGRDGWVLVGYGHEIEEVQISQAEPESATTSSSSISTCSDVTSYDPIDVGDDNSVDQAGQQDRSDGRVDAVFKLHSSRRMKPTSTGRGVSIPSQRRWCRYVHLVFTHHAPPIYTLPGTSRIRLVSVTMLLKPPSAWQKPLASLVVGSDNGRGKAWASVARYDDDYVEELRRHGGDREGVGGSITWGGVGGQGSFDKSKMFRSCGRLVPGELYPDDLETNLAEELVTHHLIPTQDLVLDRGREFRLKFHLGSLPLGWAWIIPVFHLPEPDSKRFHTLHFPKSQIDFHIGPGQSIDRILVRLEEIPDGEVAPLMTEEEERDAGAEDTDGENLPEP